MVDLESIWIPAVAKNHQRQFSLSEIGSIIKLIQQDHADVEDAAFKERLNFLKQVLTPHSEMVLVKAGCFQMGNTRNDPEGTVFEKPIHTVSLTYDFYIGRYPVTSSEYGIFLAAKNRTPLIHLQDESGPWPTGYVSWLDAVEYCNWLSEREGLQPAYDSLGMILECEGGTKSLLDKHGKPTKHIAEVEGYRLPTEAEWEYAARGGHKSKEDFKYAGCNCFDEVAWPLTFLINEDKIMGGKKPNALGLYDMSGYISEWCYDRWGLYSDKKKTNPIGPYGSGVEIPRVIRGGSTKDSLASSRLAFRDYVYPTRSNGEVGFRVSRTVV